MMKVRNGIRNSLSRYSESVEVSALLHSATPPRSTHTNVMILVPDGGSPVLCRCSAANLKKARGAFAGSYLTTVRYVFCCAHITLSTRVDQIPSSGLRRIVSNRIQRLRPVNLWVIITAR